MNAKEAIDLMEKDIDEIVEQINSLTASVMECEAKEDGAGVSYYIARCSRLERILDYKSIVLESAKKLQEIKDKALSYAFIKDIDCSNVELYDFAKWVYDKAEGFEVEK